MPDTSSANTEILKRRSWESSRSVLSSQPEEAEHDKKRENNYFSNYASVWQSDSGLNQSEPRAGEPAAAVPKGHGKPKEGSRLVRKLKQFRKGTLFVFVHIVYTETIYIYIYIYWVARSRLTHFKFEYCAGTIACHSWQEGER